MRKYKIEWDGWFQRSFGFNRLDRDMNALGRDFVWICYIGPWTIKKRRKQVD